ncbi:MAG: hypothetical protein P8H58_02925 [Luminiphilus sp.]|nr:hypothetical protein [Luminiphilus sp.]
MLQIYDSKVQVGWLALMTLGISAVLAMKAGGQQYKDHSLRLVLWTLTKRLSF